MDSMNERNLERTLTLFESKGPENTEDTLRLVGERIEKEKIGYLVVASTSGETGARAVEHFDDKDVHVVVVSHQYGYSESGKIELEDEYRKFIEKSDDVSLVVTPDVLTRVPKIVRGKYGGFSNLDLIADTLRTFSQGMKVCVECVIQAADSGNIPIGKEVAAIAGTASGADTGIILESQHSHKLFDVDIREIICMPREK